MQLSASLSIGYELNRYMLYSRKGASLKLHLNPDQKISLDAQETKL